MDDLVKRADYCHEHGLFDAVEAGNYVTYADLAAEIRRLREREARLQAIIDSRPAINAGLPETYIKWSQSVMLSEAAQAAGVVQ
jgi:hypothetical protein